MRRVKNNKPKAVVREREIRKVTKHIGVNYKVSAFLLPLFVQNRSKSSVPFFSALIAVNSVWLVLLKPNCSITASHVKDQFFRIYTPIRQIVSAVPQTGTFCKCTRSPCTPLRTAVAPPDAGICGGICRQRGGGLSHPVPVSLQALDCFYDVVHRRLDGIKRPGGVFVGCEPRNLHLDQRVL